MAADIVDYALGQHITVVTIAPITYSAGTGTVGTAKSIQAYLGEGGGISGSVDTENVSPVTSTKRNPVPLEVGTRITLTEILRKTGNDRDILAALYYGATLRCQIVYTRGGRTFTMNGLMVSYDESTRKGAIGSTVVFESFDDGAANPGIGSLA